MHGHSLKDGDAPVYQVAARKIQHAEPTTRARLMPSIEMNSIFTFGSGVGPHAQEVVVTAGEFHDFFAVSVGSLGFLA